MIQFTWDNKKYILLTSLVRFIKIYNFYYCQTIDGRAEQSRSLGSSSSVLFVNAVLDGGVVIINELFIKAINIHLWDRIGRIHINFMEVRNRLNANLLWTKSINFRMQYFCILIISYLQYKKMFKNRHILKEIPTYSCLLRSSNKIKSFKHLFCKSNYSLIESGLTY